jgi:hypothetical protein
VFVSISSTTTAVLHTHIHAHTHTHTHTHAHTYIHTYREAKVALAEEEPAGDTVESLLLLMDGGCN